MILRKGCQTQGIRRYRHGDTRITKMVQEKSDSELYQSHMDSADQVDRLENAQVPTGLRVLTELRVLTGLRVASRDLTERAYLPPVWQGDNSGCSIIISFTSQRLQMLIWSPWSYHDHLQWNNMLWWRQSYSKMLPKFLQQEAISWNRSDSLGYT